MSTLSLNRVKMIDQRNKDIVFGFCKQSQHLLPQQNTFYNISRLIYFTCLLYYHEFETEQFMSYPMHIMISDDDNKRMTMKSYKRGTAYGNVNIYGYESFIYRWT
eukprot:381483_1